MNDKTTRFWKGVFIASTFIDLIITLLILRWFIETDHSSAWIILGCINVISAVAIIVGAWLAVIGIDEGV